MDRATLFGTIVLSTLFACSSGDGSAEGTNDNNDTGDTAKGGASEGTGGSRSSGGASVSGGSSVSGDPNGTGGASASGGSSASGGAKGTGGANGSGGNGTIGTGGANGSGGNSASGGGGSGGNGAIPHTPGQCNDLAAVGVWENITPRAFTLDGKKIPTSRFVINPQDSATLYLGTDRLGIHRTTDCGASWAKVNTGKNADALDHGMQWTMAIDPVDPRVLYTNTGYGDAGPIAWKSTNGGVDWDKLVPDQYVKALLNSFVHLLTLDPSDHNHLIVTPHFTCQPGVVNGLPKTEQCLLETKDAGATWRILEGTPGSGEGGGEWMKDSQTWFWSSYFGGLARTTDGGGSWQHVVPSGNYADTDGISPDGGKTWYTGAEFNVLMSTDGGATWKTIQGSPGTTFMAGDSSMLFSVRGSSFHSAKASDPTKWTALASPKFPYPDGVMSWELMYDPDHHLLYSLHAANGFWRMRTE